MAFSSGLLGYVVGSAGRTSAPAVVAFPVSATWAPPITTRLCWVGGGGAIGGWMGGKVPGRVG
ncbi:MAG TPA: hypothetical protein VFD41_12475, partial [Actinomycetales bacterium]|nr:hypothetical protein [Actinomycetales bacterium]